MSEVRTDRSRQAEQTDTIRYAYGIAVRDLRACYNPDGIVAGRLHFNAYWARDGLWAVFGALALGDFGQAWAELNTFMRYQNRSGCIPVRVEFVGHSFGGFRKLLRRPKVVGRAGGLFSNPVDPSALFIIAASTYWDYTGDVEFCRRFDPYLDRAMGWLMSRDRDGDGLLESHFLADWMDSIMKRGKIFNINVTYYVSLRATEALKRAIGAHDGAEQYRQAADRVYAQLQEVFWNGDYFNDWVRGARRGGFSTDGNVVAMFFRVATPDQSARILQYIATHVRDTGGALRTSYPVYPWWRVFPLYHFAGIADYHRTLIWPWLGTLCAVSRHRLGDRVGALDELAQIGAWYLRWNAVSEVYTPHAVPLSRRFYGAEVPFAWNAALYVYAVNEVGLAPAPVSLEMGHRSP